MNIFIVGPMGSGKSTVGKIIASELFLTFLDTDDEIEKGTGVTHPGLPGYRACETLSSFDLISYVFLWG